MSFQKSMIASLALLGAAAALPAPSATLGAPIARSTSFGLVSKAKAPYNGLVLRVMQSGADAGTASQILVFDRQSAFSPSPAHFEGHEPDFTGGSYNGELYFETANGTSVGAVLPGGINSSEGIEGQIQLVPGTVAPQFEFEQTKGGEKYLAAKPGSSTSTFLGCVTSVENHFGTTTEYLALAYGNPLSSGEPPKGCAIVELEVVPVLTGLPTPVPYSTSSPAPRTAGSTLFVTSSIPVPRTAGSTLFASSSTPAPRTAGSTILESSSSPAPRTAGSTLAPLPTPVPY